MALFAGAVEGGFDWEALIWALEVFAVHLNDVAVEDVGAAFEGSDEGFEDFAAVAGCESDGADVGPVVVVAGRDVEVLEDAGDFFGGGGHFVDCGY